MFTISPSTAECERGFSQANCIKTSLRTSLSQDTFFKSYENKNGRATTCSGPTWSMDKFPEVRHSPGQETESMIEPGLRSGSQRSQPVDEEGEDVF